MIRETKAIIYYDTQRDLYDFKLSAPLSVCWQITTKCNLNCKFCISDSGCKGIYGFDTLTAKKVIKHLGEIGVNRLDFTGGEPLLRKDLGELIDYAKEQGINTIVTTNTILLNKENIEFLKKADLIQVSIDGPEEIHNAQRQNYVFEQTISNIKKLKTAGCKIRLNSFLFNSNKKYVDYLMNLSKELDVFSHLFIIFTPQGRGRNYTSEIINSDELCEIKNRILQEQKESGRNIRLYDYNEYLHSCVLLTPDGDVVSQGFYEEDSIVVGNVLEEPLDKIFLDDAFDHPTHVLHYLQRRKND